MSRPELGLSPAAQERRWAAERAAQVALRDLNGWRRRDPPAIVETVIGAYRAALRHPTSNPVDPVAAPAGVPTVYVSELTLVTGANWIDACTTKFLAEAKLIERATAIGIDATDYTVSGSQKLDNNADVLSYGVSALTVQGEKPPAPTDPSELIRQVVDAVGAMERSPFTEVLASAMIGQTNLLGSWKHFGGPSAVDLARATIKQLERTYDL